MTFLAVFAMLLPSVTKAAEVLLMTYNIRYDNPADGNNTWANRKSSLIEQIHLHNPDILGIQEAMPNQVANLADALPEYAYVGVGRDPDNTGEGVPIFFNKNHFEVLESSTFWLSETPGKPSTGWDAAMNRICVYALFKVTDSKQKFWVFNCHFDHQGETAKAESARLVLAMMQRLNVNKLPVLLMGDFNSMPESVPLAILKNQMVDSFDASHTVRSGPTGTFSGFYAEQPVLNRIDYIFSDKAFQVDVLSYRTIQNSADGRYPSDHLPVMVKMRF